MARHESDREDLMREATALRERAEFRIPAVPETVIAGYRRDGSLSIYFGPDPCYHFDPAGRLRRAYIDGQLYRTQRDTLARLTRVRTDRAVELRRRDLSDGELSTLRGLIRERITQLHRSLLDTSTKCVANHPDDVDLRPRCIASLRQILACDIELAPAIRGKKR